MTIAVSEDAILKKIQKELTQANEKLQQPTDLRRHISNIHVLCELFLDNNTSKDSAPSIGQTMRTKSHSSFSDKEKNMLESKDLPPSGDSIFDF
ncbi:DUF5327 family protein [Virgibacillus sp. W0181]|uniref:DUF5327 family protein n=1 Tax=Virgibacillus sp. W0181 TaxID=3391581 RepID=UPI003F453FD5